MNLAIVVVYKLDETLGPLLDVHLDRITAHTRMPYTLYGAAVGLGESMRARLLAHGRVVLPDLPTTTATGAAEHAHYLDHLTRLAFEDGASHVVTLHLDSFPVADGWAERLAERLSPDCAVVSLTGGNTACMMIERGFYLAHRPTLSHDDPRTAALASAHGLHLHSGLGWLLAAHQAGRSWHLLPDTTPPDARAGRAGVFGGLLVHLVGTVRLGVARPAEAIAPPRPPNGLAALARAILPAAARLRLRRWLAVPIERRLDAPRRAAKRARVVDGYRDLLADPDGFIERLRGGGR